MICVDAESSRPLGSVTERREFPRIAKRNQKYDCLLYTSSFSTAAAEPIKELNISYVKPPFVLQLLVMKDRQLLEKEFQADGIKINWHNMGTSPQAARAMSSGSLDIAGNMNTAALLMLNSEGLPVRVVTGTAHPTSNFAIVSKPGTELSLSLIHILRKNP